MTKKSPQNQSAREKTGFWSLSQKAESLLFCLTILFLPTQFGRHFWPNYTHILGIRVDYLAPTLYFTDVLILLLLCLWLFRNIKNLRQRRISLWLKILKIKLFSIRYFLLAIFCVAIGIYFSKAPLVGWYGLLKLVEIIFFGFYTKGFIEKNGIKSMLLLFCSGIIFESGLSIAQFFQHGSLDGIFYYLGERTFNSTTPGIANASINGSLVMRPYATFPHPNVLAGYVTIAMAMVISNFQFPISNFKRLLFGFSILLGTIALLLTLSRVAIALWLVFLLIASYKKINISGKRFFLLCGLIACFLVVFILTPLHYRFAFSLTDESVVQREALAHAAIAMFQKQPLFGVGLGNYLVELPGYLKTSSVFLLQPVHNIYLLVLAETGIIGLLFFIWFIFKTFKNIKYQIVPTNSIRAGSSMATAIGTNSKNQFLILNSKFLILSMVLILGFFDHYFLTLQQGQLLFGFVMGFCWAKNVG